MNTFFQEAINWCLHNFGTAMIIVTIFFVQIISWGFANLSAMRWVSLAWTAETVLFLFKPQLKSLVTAFVEAGRSASGFGLHSIPDSVFALPWPSRLFLVFVQLAIVWGTYALFHFLIGESSAERERIENQKKKAELEGLKEAYRQQQEEYQTRMGELAEENKQIQANLIESQTKNDLESKAQADRLNSALQLNEIKMKTLEQELEESKAKALVASRDFRLPNGWEITPPAHTISPQAYAKLDARQKQWLHLAANWKENLSNLPDFAPIALLLFKILESVFRQTFIAQAISKNIYLFPNLEGGVQKDRLTPANIVHLFRQSRSVLPREYLRCHAINPDIDQFMMNAKNCWRDFRNGHMHVEAMDRVKFEKLWSTELFGAKNILENLLLLVSPSL